MTRRDKPQANKVTLLISTYNWVDALKRVLEGVRKQTVLPYEVVIADDGSREDTREFIDEVKKDFPVRIKHVWHEDDGFRRSVILNKAIAQAEGDYIIEMDGDVIPERHFVQDHMEVMEQGYYVCGSRVMLDAEGRVRTSHYLNLIRCKPLRRYMAKKEPQFSTRHIRGCNLAFWRKDFIAVNGYNEAIVGWGHEDHELIYRMMFNGVKERRLKFGGVIHHIYHGEPSKANKQNNNNIQDDTVRNKSTWCEKGINQWL